MSTHNICFCGEIKKVSVLFGRNKQLIQSMIKLQVYYYDGFVIAVIYKPAVS